MKRAYYAKPTEEEYWKEVEKFKQVVKTLGRTLTIHEFIKNEYNLPTSRWFVKHCPNMEVKNYYQFVEFLGLIPNFNISKELATKIILELQNSLDRPIILKDFIDNENIPIGIKTIKNHWGTFNKMKEELSLEIVQENMIDRQKTKEEMIDDVRLLIGKLGRVPTSKDLKNNPNIASRASYHLHFGGLNNVLLKLGYEPYKKSVSLHLSNEDIINIYKDFAQDLETTPTYGYCKKIYQLPSPRTIVRRFNCSWNEFMAMIDCVPNSQNKRGEICYAKDGTQCLSIAELITHNYFLDNNINIVSKEYLYRDLIEDEILKNQIGYKRCDWLLQKNDNFYIVEYFGLMGNKDYEKRHDDKLQFIKDINLEKNFIPLYPKDLNKLDIIFKDFIVLK